MIYLDNAATSFPKPESVIKKIIDCMTHYCANPGRSGHDMSSKMAKEIFETREIISDFFNIEDPLRIIFTSNATESLNLAIKGLLHPGDHVITTMMEHNSVLRPLRELENISITLIPTDNLGRISLTQIESSIKINTKLIICTHSSNVTGTVLPIKDIGKICRRHNLLFLVDASQSAGSIPIDVKNDYIDLLACPGHKSLFGCQGTGFLYVKTGISLIPLKCGGTGTDSANLHQPRYFPEGYESGTVNGPGIISIKEGLKFINKIGLSTIHNWESHICELLYNELKNIPSIKIYGPENQFEKTSIVTINIKNKSCEDVAYELNKYYKIAVRAGYHCSPLAHKAIGTYDIGAVRLSPGIFNNESDIYKAIDAIYAISNH